MSAVMMTQERKDVIDILTGNLAALREKHALVCDERDMYKRELTEHMWWERTAVELQRQRDALFAELATFKTGHAENIAKGTHIIIHCAKCSAEAELPRVGKENEFVSLKMATGWQLYPQHLCAACAKL